jgi:PAS domain S-box-containing protein
MISISIVTAICYCILVFGSAFLVTRIWKHYHSKLASKKNTSSLKLQISKKELELVFDAIPERVCILDGDFNVIRANKSYAEAAGLQIKDVLEKKCFEAQWQKREHCKNCPVFQTFKEGVPVVKKRLSFTYSESIQHFEISAYPVVDNRGKVPHVIEFTRDITEEKQMIEQLIRSEKLASIGNMTAGIAHEMNNPLSGISGNATNLLRMPQKYGINEKGISRVTTILNAAARATAIMNDLLHLSCRPEQTSIMVNINALLVKTANAVLINGSQEIERRFEIDDTMPPILCDPSKIQQVIVHIVTNALQAVIDRRKSESENSSYSGKLIVASQHKEKHALIMISDDGIGISEQNRSKVFDPFFSTRPTGQGTGLGLSVSSKIIEEHGGTINFDRINGMTIFSISLPFQQPENMM